MSKLSLIIGREYSSRVKKRSFIITTLLVPLAFVALGVLSGIIASNSKTSNQKIALIDNSGVVASVIKSTDDLQFESSNKLLSSLQQSYVDDGYDAVVIIPEYSNYAVSEYGIKYLSEEKPGVNTMQRIQNRVEAAVKMHRVKQAGIDAEVYENLKTDVDFQYTALNSDGSINEESTESNSSKASFYVSMALGGLMGFLMYVFIFAYGGMVMRGVMEEKMNRIVEVIISSVKPFQLMLGKIIGIGAVGLTQLAIWAIILTAGSMILGSVMMPGMAESSIEMANADVAQIQETAESEMMAAFQALGGINWFKVVGLFVIYFLGGYLIYASMFAAIGSAISDDMGESQQLMLPIMIPVILAFIMMMSVIENPNSPMAVFGSIFPLTSPILMPARLAMDPPWWQIVVSVIVLISTAIGIIYLTGRIYRIGILMYGKKVNFKTLGKWLFYKG